MQPEDYLTAIKAEAERRGDYVERCDVGSFHAVLVVPKAFVDRAVEERASAARKESGYAVPTFR